MKYGCQDILVRAKLSFTMALNLRVISFHFSNIFLLDQHALLSNSQANAIMERIHQGVGSMLKTKDLSNIAFDTVSP